MLKILTVGNSFSQDATALVDFLTDGIFVRNLFYPGCSLEQHCDFLDNDECAYEYQHNGAKCLPDGVSLRQALAMEKWDYITVQQASGFSGIEDSYYPYINKLIDFIRSHSDAEIVFHQTWTYENEAEHPDFVKYDRNKAKMWDCIRNASETVCKNEKLRIIECGKAVYTLGQHDLFNRGKGGISLYRDGYHLSVNYGRFLTACVFIKFFTSELPSYFEKTNLTEEYMLIKRYLLN